MKLHLGCGLNKLKGYVNLDSSRKVSPDKVWNLEKTPLPFKDNSFDEVLAEHVLEHLTNFVELMHDLRRICKKKAIIKIKVPFYTSCEAFTDPTHRRFFTPFTFDYFNANSKIGKFSHEVGCSGEMFKIKKVKINFSVGRSRILNRIFNPIINLNQRAYCKFFSGLIPASELEFELEVLK
jgi:hypothetical protein